MSNSVRPTRLRRPWDSPGKNTGVGYHFLLQCMKVKIESEVAQLCPCPTLRDPVDCSLPGSSVHGIFRQEYWSGVPLPSPVLVSTVYRNESALHIRICPPFVLPSPSSPHRALSRVPCAIREVLTVIYLHIVLIPRLYPSQSPNSSHPPMFPLSS